MPVAEEGVHPAHLRHDAPSQCFSCHLLVFLFLLLMNVSNLTSKFVVRVLLFVAYVYFLYGLGFIVVLCLGFCLLALNPPRSIAA